MGCRCSICRQINRKNPDAERNREFDIWRQGQQCAVHLLVGFDLGDQAECERGETSSSNKELGKGMRKREISSIYLTGLAQGVALVAFPAASAIFTNPQAYNFSSAAYGGLFIPQAVMSIISSLLSARLSNKGLLKTSFMSGLCANFLSMLLFLISALFMHDQWLAYGILLFATACLGVGFGLTVPSLNTYAALFFPHKVDTAILILNALLGLGTALAPVLIAIFTGLGIWWGLPLLLTMLILGLFIFSVRLPLQQERKAAALDPIEHKTPIPSLFWIFAAFIFLYGIVETINGNWATVYMVENLKANPATASFALTAFWGMVTVGRVFFGAVGRFLPPRIVYQILPFVTAGAFLLIFLASDSSPLLDIAAFGMAGFGCSALLPLSISFGTTSLPSIKTSVAGGIIAFYLLGYGVAAFGVGALHDLTGLSLKAIFGFSTIISLALGGLSFIVSRNKKLLQRGTYES